MDLDEFWKIDIKDQRKVDEILEG